MTSRDIVIGAISGYDFETIRFWVNSLDASGFAGDKVVLVCNAAESVVEALRRRSYSVVTYARDPETNRYYYPAPGFQDEDASAFRFCLMHQYLRTHWTDDWRYVISVDVRDAVFQSDPSVWLGAHLGAWELNVSSEGLVYADEEWNSASLLENFGPQVYERLHREVIWNAGVLAGRAAIFRDFCLNVHLLCRSARSPYSDQAAVNVLLSMEPYKRLTRFSLSEDGWACQAGTMADPGVLERNRGTLLEPEPVLDGGSVWTRSGRKYCIVHQYDRVPEWLVAFRSRYG